MAAPAKDVDDRRVLFGTNAGECLGVGTRMGGWFGGKLGRVLFRDTLGHPRRTPMAVDARGSRRSNALELFATVVLDLGLSAAYCCRWINVAWSVCLSVGHTG